MPQFPFFHSNILIFKSTAKIIDGAREDILCVTYKSNLDKFGRGSFERPQKPRAVLQLMEEAVNYIGDTVVVMAPVKSGA